MTRRIVLLAAIASFALPATASAATRLVSPAGADAGDCTVTACLHIQYAVDQAVANDTVSIAAGTYDTEPNNQVVINKGLILSGAGIGASILDGNGAHGLPVAGTLSIQTSTGDPVSVSGLTVREPGSQSGAHGADSHYAIFAKGTSPAGVATYTFDGVRVEGAGNGGRDYNFYAVGSNANLVLQNSEFTNADFNPILLERSQGTADVNGNIISKATGTNSSAFFDMNYSGGTPGNPTGVAGLHQFRNNTVDASGFSGVSISAAPAFVGSATGGFTAVEVSGNTFTGLGATSVAVSITNDSTDPSGIPAQIVKADVDGNAITGPGGIGARFRGLVSGIAVAENQIVGLTRGIQFNAATAGHAPAASEVHLNRIVDNGTAQLEQNAGGAVNAENNWWGCNEGPNSGPDCGTVTGATVDFNPWLVLGLSAAPTSIPTGGATSQIDADLTHNSAGAQPGSAHPDGFPVVFGTNLGSITSPDPVNAGSAQSTLTSGPTAGIANATATVDNEIATTPVTFTASGGGVLGKSAGPPKIKRRIRSLNVRSDGLFQIATVRCRSDSCKVTRARAAIKVGGVAQSPPVSVNVKGKGSGSSLARGDVASVIIEFPEDVQRQLVSSHLGELVVEIAATSDGGDSSATKRITLKAKYLKRLFG